MITTKRGRQPTAAVEPHARKVENTLHEAGERSLIERTGPVAVDHAVGVGRFVGADRGVPVAGDRRQHHQVVLAHILDPQRSREDVPDADPRVTVRFSV